MQNECDASIASILYPFFPAFFRRQSPFMRLFSLDGKLDPRVHSGLSIGSDAILCFQQNYFISGNHVGAASARTRMLTAAVGRAARLRLEATLRASAKGPLHPLPPL
jgi:hypothetical protein